MSGKQAVIAVLLMAMCILGGSAAAQDEKNELTGMVGRMVISDQGIVARLTPTRLSAPARVSLSKSTTPAVYLAKMSTQFQGKSPRFSIWTKIWAPVAMSFLRTTSRYLSLPPFVSTYFPPPQFPPGRVLAAASPTSTKTRISTITVRIREAHRLLACCKADWESM